MIGYFSSKISFINYSAFYVAELISDNDQMIRNRSRTTSENRRVIQNRHRESRCKHAPKSPDKNFANSQEPEEATNDKKLKGRVRAVPGSSQRRQVRTPKPGSTEKHECSVSEWVQCNRKDITRMFFKHDILLSFNSVYFLDILFCTGKITNISPLFEQNLFFVPRYTSSIIWPWVCLFD